MATIESLMRRTVKNGECLEFTGHIAKCGYGLVWHDGKNQSAHRVSFELHNMPIMDGQHVMHRCDNRKCVNPDHLILGSHQQNIDDMMRKKRNKQVSGGDHPFAKLSREIVFQIQRRYKPHDRKNGSSALAREFGVSQGTVHLAATGKTWK